METGISFFHRGPVVPKRRQGILCGILVGLFAIVFFFLEEGTGLFSDNRLVSYISDEQFLFLSVLEFLLFAAILIIAYAGYRTTTQWGWLAVALIVATGNTVAVLTNCSDVIYKDAVVYTFGAIEKARFIVLGILNGAFFFVAFSIVPRIVTATFWIRFLYRVIIAMALISVGYSLLAEWDLWQPFFETWELTGGFGSFYHNKNIFATVLFFALCSEALLMARTPRWWRWIVFLFLALCQVPLVSRTQSLLTLGLVVLVPILFYARSLKAHKVRNNVALAVVLALVVAAGVYLSLPNHEGESSLLSMMADFFHSIITSGGNNLVARFEIAERVFNLVNSFGSMSTAFGLGFKSSLYIYCGMMNGNVHAMAAVDGEYIYSYLAGGAIGAVLELIVWFFVLVAILKAMNKGMKEAPISLVLWCIFAVRSFFEMSGFLYFESFSMGVYAVVALTPLCFNYLQDHREINQGIAASLAVPERERQAISRSSFVVLRRILCLSSTVIAFAAMALSLQEDPLSPFNLSYLYGLAVYSFLGTAMLSAFESKRNALAGKIIASIGSLLVFLLAFAGPFILPPAVHAIVITLLAIIFLAVLAYARLLPPLLSYAPLYFPFLVVVCLSLTYAEVGLMYLNDDGFFYVSVFLATGTIWVIVYLLSSHVLFNGGFDRPLLRLEEEFDRWSIVNEAKMEDLYFRKVVRKRAPAFRKKES